MKYLLIVLCSALTFNVFAQQNPLAKTTWQVASTGDSEVIRLKKIKLVDFTKKDAPFTGLYFDQSAVFHSGNSCEGYSGGYKISSGNVLVLEPRDGYAGENCIKPLSLDGAYQFTLEGDMLTLSPIEDYEENNEDAYTEATAAEGAEISEAAIAAMAAEEERTGEAATEVTMEPETAAPVVKYEAFKIWAKAHLGNEFFRKQQLKEDVEVVLSLWIGDNGKTIVKEISGTDNETLKRAITRELGKMPVWNKGEVDFNNTIKVPLRYKAGS